MKNCKFWIAVPVALTVAAAPIPVYALDLGKTARSVSRSVSKTVSKALGGRSRNSNQTQSTQSSSTDKSGTSVGVGGTSVSIGSGQKGGLNLSVKSSLLGTQADVNLLSRTGVADVNVESGLTGSAHVGVLSRGQLATLGINSSLPGTGGGGGIGGGPGSVPGGAVTPDYVRGLLADMNRIEQQAFKLRCKDVLRSPKAFDTELIQLCQILATIT